VRRRGISWYQNVGIKKVFISKTFWRNHSKICRMWRIPYQSYCEFEANFHE